MKTVNLEEILTEKCSQRRWYISTELKADLSNAMREACNQAIELAAKNAQAFSDCYDQPRVSKGSILNTKSQII